MWQTLRKEEVLRQLGTDEKHGLTEKEVQARQEKYGKNKLKEKKKESFIVKFIKQFNDFMIISPFTSSSAFTSTVFPFLIVFAS